MPGSYFPSRLLGTKLLRACAAPFVKIISDSLSDIEHKNKATCVLDRSQRSIRLCGMVEVFSALDPSGKTLVFGYFEKCNVQTQLRHTERSCTAGVSCKNGNGLKSVHTIVPAQACHY